MLLTSLGDNNHAPLSLLPTAEPKCAPTLQQRTASVSLSSADVSPALPEATSSRRRRIWRRTYLHSAASQGSHVGALSVACSAGSARGDQRVQRLPPAWPARH